MPGGPSRSRLRFHHFAAVLGVALLAYLIVRVGPTTLLRNVKAIGWGLVFVIALGGVSHVVKTWAWRLALPITDHNLAFSKTLALRLISEAVGQFGLVGQVFGEAMRVSMLGSGVPAGVGISSVTLDRGIFIASGAAVTTLGLLASIVVVALPGRMRFYALAFAAILLVFLAVLAYMALKRVRVVSGSVRALSRWPRLGLWFKQREAVIESAERELLNFYHESPREFWLSVVLNVLTHTLAIAEVYFILLFMGARVGIVGALILESLTKLINVVGALNPGNVGTYEGGNMLIGRLFRLSPTTGLTLALCRRFRSIFWAIIGGLCLLWYSRSDEPQKQQIEAA